VLVSVSACETLVVPTTNSPKLRLEGARLKPAGGGGGGADAPPQPPNKDNPPT
jgi:hypothetical protein